MGGGEFDLDPELDEAARSQLVQTRMNQLRLMGQLLVVLGGFLIAAADTVQGTQVAGRAYEAPTAGGWFQR